MKRDIQHDDHRRPRACSVDRRTENIRRCVRRLLRRRRLVRRVRAHGAAPSRKSARDQLHKARIARDERRATDKALEELNAICPWRRAELGRERVRWLVDRRRLDEAIALAESLISGDCAGEFDSLQELDQDLYSAGVYSIAEGGNAERIKSLRALAMSACRRRARSGRRVDRRRGR